MVATTTQQRAPGPAAPATSRSSTPEQRSLASIARGVAREGGGFDAQEAALAPVQLKGKKKGESAAPEQETPESQHEDAGARPESKSQLREEIKGCGDWNAVKAKWVKRDPDVMQRLVDYRQAEVDLLVEQMKSTFEGLSALSLGSKALTSDYDITFSGPPAVQAVVEFNKRFGRVWGAEAGSVFDTNVYAQNFLQTGKPETGDPDQLAPVKGGAGAQAKDDAQMDVAALVKVRKNMDESSWEAFKNAVVGRISEPMRANESARRFDQADQTFRTVYVKQLLAGLKKESPKEVAALQKEGKDDAAIVEELLGGKGGLAAANRLYEKKLLRVEELVFERDQLVQKQKEGTATEVTRLRLDALSLEIRRAHSEALLFANEPYFSAGTIRHVVGNMQGQWDLDVGANEHFQSFNENFGDTLKELHHLSGKEPAEVLVKSSKYVYRFLDAATHLAAQARIKLPSDIELFKQCESQLLDIRQGRGSGDAVQIASRVGVRTADDLQKKVYDLSVQVNARTRGKGAAGSSVEDVDAPKKGGGR